MTTITWQRGPFLVQNRRESEGTGKDALLWSAILPKVPGLAGCRQWEGRLATRLTAPPGNLNEKKLGAHCKSSKSMKPSFLPRAIAWSIRFQNRLFCDNARASRSVSSVTGTSATQGRPFLVITTDFNSLRSRPSGNDGSHRPGSRPLSVAVPNPGPTLLFTPAS